MSNGGSYPSTPKIELLDDGRIVKLLQEFVYIDPKGTRWAAPEGAQADGASIPKALWSLMGGPFEGKYRNGALIHDFYCSKRHKPWKAVHRMFYDAITTSGVGKKMAQIMYAAIYWAGPKWTEMDIHNAALPEGNLQIIRKGDVYTTGHAGMIGPGAVVLNIQISNPPDIVERSRGARREGRATKKMSNTEKRKGRPEGVTRAIVSQERPALTMEHVELLTKRLKTRGADFKSIERQVDELLSE